MKYTTVVFDLDGTLLNTLEDLTDSTNYALEAFGLPTRSIEEIRHFVGNGVRKLIERAVPEGENDPDFEEIFSTFKTHYSKNCRNKTRPYDGIREMLEKLSHSDYKMAIVSNKFDSAVKKLCDEFFWQYISVAVGNSDGVKPKPAPDTVFTALKELGSEPDEAVYVGDSQVDIETAKNAGLDIISVSWGFRTKQELKDAGATTIIEKPEDLPALI
jgi:phosphoglycolate phosphatase